MTKKEASIITVLSAAAIALALLLSARLWFRLDLTAGKVYTISDVSRSLADEIPDRVKISYFVSERLGQLYPQPGEISDLLREYVTYSRGKITFAVRDPVKDGVEAEMERLGIPSRQIQTVERNEATVAMVYSGILLEYMDKSDVIPFVFSLETLEYDLTSRIRALVNDRTREAGIIMADTAKSLDQNFRNLSQMLTASGYKVREVKAGAEIPAVLTCLFVIGGIDTLDDAALFIIDAYIQRGGKCLFMPEYVTPVIGDAGPPEARPLDDKGLAAMLASYGADVQKALALDESSRTITYRTGGGGIAPVIRLARYPFWITVLRENGNPEHPITSTFSGLDLFWPNPIELKEVDGVEAVPLLFTTPDAWLKTQDWTISPDSAYMFDRQQSETLGRKTLAVALSGRFPSFWRGKPVPSTVPEAVPETMPDEAAESRIVVIGNIEFLNDEYLDSDRNLTFCLLAADWLSNDDDIIAIRSRASGASRLDRIIDGDRKSAAMNFARVLNIALIPLAVLVFAFVLFFRRNRRAGAGNASVQATEKTEQAKNETKGNGVN
jgi:ABC-type uncharacterized transport system involved in gliding motility auxiliary subunit